MLKLTAPTKEAVLEVVNWRNEDLSTLRTPFFLTKEMQADFYQDVICNRNSSHRYWLIANDDKLVGLGGLTSIQWENSIAEISLIVEPDHRRNGLGTKAVDLILAEGFGNLNLHTIFGEVYLCNPAHNFWKKAVEKYGGYATILPDRKFWNGKYYDAMYFSIERKNYYEKEQK